MGFLLALSLSLGCRFVSFATAADHVDFTVDGVDYVVSERYTEEEVPDGFERETLEINGRTYAEPVSKDITLLYLKPAADTSGSGEFYIYDEAANSVEKFFMLGTSDSYVIPLSGDASAFTKLMETSITVDDETIPVFQLEESTNDFYYVYGIGSDGEEEWYTYRESNGQVARADTYALFLITKASEDTAETTEEEPAKDEKSFNISGLLGDDAKNILVVIVVVVAIIIIFLINLKVFRNNDEDDDIWAEPDDDDENDEDEMPVREAPKRTPRSQVRTDEVNESPEPQPEAAPSEKAEELPAEEAILRNAMAGIMDEEPPVKVASAIDSLPKINAPKNEQEGDGEITMIDLNNL